MKLLCVTLYLLLNGCASLSSNSTDGGPYGPESKTPDSRTGQVVYNPVGLKELVDMRREAALKKIFEYCGNTTKYKITKEYTSSANDVKDSSIATMAASNVQVIEFECNVK
jgi:hypothetical protein